MEKLTELTRFELLGILRSTSQWHLPKTATIFRSYRSYSKCLKYFTIYLHYTLPFTLMYIIL